MLFLWLDKTPPKWNPPLSVQEGFKILILKILLSPPFEHNEIPIWKIISIEKLFLKLGGGAVLLLWAHAFSPFGMNRQKRILWVKYKPLVKLLSPLWQIKTWVKIIPKTVSCSERRRRMSYGVEWKPLSSPKTPIPFQYTYDLVWNPLENTLVIAYIKETWSKVYLRVMCASLAKKIPRIKNI